MKILWFTWKDKKNPRAGGAELLNEGIAEKLVQNGHEVIFVVAGFDGCLKEEMVNGYKIIRLGNKWKIFGHEWNIFLATYRYYRKNLQGWADVVIDEVNTVPFFCKFYVKEKNFIFIHQLAGVVWFYEMFFPLNFIGYVLEKIYLRALNGTTAITVSDSTKQDLIKLGFKENKIHIISEGINLTPVENIQTIKKYDSPTILAMGAIRAVKRTDQIVKAFAIAKKEIPDLRLIIAGEAHGKFGGEVLKLINRGFSKYVFFQNPTICACWRSVFSLPTLRRDQRDVLQKQYFENPLRGVTYLGKIDESKKIELMQKCHIVCSTSAKEGWGLTITEANSQGAPAVVYDVNGLRNSVRHNETGVVCAKNTPKELAKQIVALLKNKPKYEQLRANAWQWSKEINFDKSYNDFMKAIEKL